jgi:hypothetical protein
MHCCTVCLRLKVCKKQRWCDHNLLICLYAMSEFFKRQREARTIHVFTEKFTEGDWHSFYVLKLLQIPGEDYYYLLKSKSGNRLLMAAAPYHNYGIRAGSTVKCRVDKISCSGKIYLEPAHPQYETGKTYDFEIISQSRLTDRKGRIISRYNLTDSEKQHFQASLHTKFELLPQDRIRGLLQRIRKGVLIMSDIRVINNC